ncbi:hypothetical protein AAMO2058_001196600 [Amorphochlora amoebiformis]
MATATSYGCLFGAAWRRGHGLTANNWHIIAIFIMAGPSFCLESTLESSSDGVTSSTKTEVIVEQEGGMEGGEGECLPAFQISDWNLWFEENSRHMYSLMDSMDRIELMMPDVSHHLHLMKAHEGCFVPDGHCPYQDGPGRLLLEESWQKLLQGLERTLESDVHEDLRDISRQFYDSLYELPSLAENMDSLGVRRNKDYHTVAMGFWRLTGLFDAAYDLVKGITKSLDECHRHSIKGFSNEFKSEWLKLENHLRDYEKLQIPKEFDGHQTGPWIIVFEFWKSIGLEWDRRKREGTCEDRMPAAQI